VDERHVERGVAWRSCVAVAAAADLFVQIAEYEAEFESVSERSGKLRFRFQ